MYFAPYIDESGLHYPTYDDILEDNIKQAKKIFGADIYLGNDSADYQLLSILSLKQYDSLQALAMAYNSRSPATAVGAALDAVVKLNGIARKPGSKSTCDVEIKGIEGVQIKDGKIKGPGDTKWALPYVVTIPPDGTVTVTATCEDDGAYTAAPGTLTEIETPTYGWLSVTNKAAAIPGQNVETDAELRQRQTLAVAAPSQTLLEGTRAALAAIPGVKRYTVYENDTNRSDVTDENPHGLPPHCVCCVVEGGDVNAIAEAILIHKGIGCYTHGDLETTIVDRGDFKNVVRFFRPKERKFMIKVSLKKHAGFSYSSQDQVKRAVLEYILNLDIGATISPTMLIAVAEGCNANKLKPTFSAMVSISESGSYSKQTVDLKFNEIASVDISSVAVEVV